MRRTQVFTGLKTLDQNVTVIDPREAEAAFIRQLKGVRTAQEAERAAEESLERRLKSKEEHPRGNKDLTLTALIVRTVEENSGLAAAIKGRRRAAVPPSWQAMMHEPIRSEYRGWWRIIETSQWVNDGLDILGPALISLTGYADRLRMHALLAYVNCKPTKSGVSFTWEGAWEFDPVSGSGRVTPGKDGRLRGVIRIKDGDASTFIAERAIEPEEPIPAPSSYRDKWRRRW